MRIAALGRMVWIVAATVMAAWATPADAQGRIHVRPESTNLMTIQHPCGPGTPVEGPCYGSFFVCDDPNPYSRGYSYIVGSSGLYLTGECRYTITRSPNGDTHRLRLYAWRWPYELLMDSGEVAYGDGSRIQLRGSGQDGCGWDLQLDLRLAPICDADIDDGSMTGYPDGGVTLDDLLYYLFIFTEGYNWSSMGCSFCPSDCSPDPFARLLQFLLAYEQGC